MVSKLVTNLVPKVLVLVDRRRHSKAIILWDLHHDCNLVLFHRKPSQAHHISAFFLECRQLAYYPKQLHIVLVDRSPLAHHKSHYLHVEH